MKELTVTKRKSPHSSAAELQIMRFTIRTSKVTKGTKQTGTGETKKATNQEAVKDGTEKIKVLGKQTINEGQERGY